MSVMVSIDSSSTTVILSGHRLGCLLGWVVVVVFGCLMGMAVGVTRVTSMGVPGVVVVAIVVTMLTSSSMATYKLTIA